MPNYGNEYSLIRVKDSLRIAETVLLNKLKVLESHIFRATMAQTHVSPITSNGRLRHFPLGVRQIAFFSTSTRNTSFLRALLVGIILWLPAGQHG